MGRLYFKFTQSHQNHIENIEKLYGKDVAYDAMQALSKYALYDKEIEDDKLKMLIGMTSLDIATDTQKEEMLLNFLRSKYKNNEKPNKGYVYIIRINQYYKIGQTTNPEKRFGEYTKLMHEPETICCVYCDNYIKIEKELHKMFSDKNTNGEWFILSDKELYKKNEIKSE